MTNKEKQKEALMNYRMLRQLYEGTIDENIIIGMAINAVNVVMAEYPDEDEIKTTEITDVRSIIEKYILEGDRWSTTDLMKAIKRGEKVGSTKAQAIIKEAEKQEIIVRKYNKFQLP